MARHGIQEQRARPGRLPATHVRQDKSREVRRGRLAEERRHIRHLARGATAHDSLLIHPTHKAYGNSCTSPAEVTRSAHGSYLSRR
jgi:hypothetical protein